MTLTEIVFQISTVKEAFIDISLPIIEERVSCHNYSSQNLCKYYKSLMLAPPF